MSAFDRIALIGFGEVGEALALDLAEAGVAEVSAWDLAFTDPDSTPSRALARHTVRAAISAPDAVRGAGLVISAVTAAQTLQAAESVSPGLDRGTYFLDLNACSPGQKRASAQAIDGAGGRYVEAAVMSPIHPRRTAVPMHLGGVHVADFLAAADGLFPGARACSETIGQAAATKLCRSVVIKGIEALLAESMLAARRYGVEQAVLDSLSDLLPLPDWNATAQYMLSRSLEHGARRAEEMREAARTVEDAGVQPLMSQAIAQRQDWAAGHKDAVRHDLAAMLDLINAAIEENRR